MQINATLNDAKVINENIVLISPEFHLWSGRRAIKPEKFAEMNPNGLTLPPAALASLGSVKLVDPEEIKVFERIKDDVNRLLACKGLKLFGGYAISVDDFEAVRAELLVQQAKFEDLRADLLVTLDPKIAAWATNWVRENPSYHSLLQNLPTAVSVCERMSFDFHAFRIAPPQEGDGSEASGEYRTKLQGLRGELYREAAKEASVLMKEYLVKDDGSKREYITQKTLGPIKRISERLRHFTFIDPAAGPLADVIDWTMQQVPSEGRVDGTGLMAVWNMARLLSNPTEAARIGQIAIQTSPEDAWSVFTDATQPTVTATATPTAAQPQQAQAEKVDATADLENFATALESFRITHVEENQVDSLLDGISEDVAHEDVLQTQEAQEVEKPADVAPNPVAAITPKQAPVLDLGLLF